MQYENITIKISKASDEEYFYDIYLMAPDEITDDTDSEDGGQCTSEDVRDAIEMASAQACEFLVNYDNKNNQ